MNKTQTQRQRVIRELQLSDLDKSMLNRFGLTHITDLMIMKQKFFIMVYACGMIKLHKSYTGECYGEITLSHAKRLINNNNK